MKTRQEQHDATLPQTSFHVFTNLSETSVGLPGSEEGGGGG